MKSVLIIGMGRFGQHLACKKKALGNDVMIVDRDADRINAIAEEFTDSHIGDCTNAAVIRSLGVKSMDLCFVSIGEDFQSSLIITSLLKREGAKQVVAKANQEIQAELLQQIGADEIVYPEQQVARWTAVRYTADHILDYIELDEAHSIFEVAVPRSWIGKSIGEVDIRKKYNINIIAVKQHGKTVVSVTPDTLLTEDRTLLVIGEDRALQKCFHI